jgi:hypothetical protein
MEEKTYLLKFAGFQKDDSYLACGKLANGSKGTVRISKTEFEEHGLAWENNRVCIRQALYDRWFGAINDFENGRTDYRAHLIEYANKHIKGKRGVFRILCNGLYTDIPKSYIADNGLIVFNSQVFLTKERFENLFKTEIEAREKEREAEAQRKEESRRRQQAIFDSFYGQMPLFWANREMLLKEPRYYSAMSPTPLFAGLWGPAVKVTLGQLFMIWENVDILSGICEECGGKVGIYYFAGSYLNGGMYKSKHICLKCGKTDAGYKLNREFDDMHSFGQRRRAACQYPPISPQAEEPASYAEIVAACKGEKYNAETDEGNIESTEPSPFTYKIGNRKISGEQFNKYLFGR